MLGLAWHRIGRTGLARRGARYAFLGPPTVTGAALVLSIAAYAEARDSLDNHAFRVNARMTAVLEDSYRRNLPIVCHRRPKPIWGAFSVLVDDALLVDHGRLEIPETRRVSRRLWYLAKKPDAYSRHLLERMIKRGCVLDVSRRARFLRLRPDHRLPVACDAELRR